MRTAMIIGWLWCASAAWAAPTGVWKGALEVDGSAWPIRLIVGEGGASLLEIERLGMFRVPTDLGCDPDCVLDLPFGLGPFTLQPDGEGRLRSDSLVGGWLQVGLRLERTGDEPGYTAEDVAFESSDGVRLSGTVFAPRAEGGARAGVVVVDGSAIASRDKWESRRWVRTLLDAGAAVLVYDRRGAGRSQDGADEPGFASLSDDALSALRTLGERTGRDGVRLGLMGCSQGAWVAARAANESDMVSFLILTGVPGVTPGEQQRQHVEAAMRAADRDEDEIDAALAYTDLYFRVVGREVPFAELEPRAEAAGEAPWGEFVDQPRTDEDLAWWRRHHDFDMDAALRVLRVPVLALWGERDTVVPPGPNTEPVRRALAGSGAEATLLVCAGADHPLELRGFTRDDADRWVWPGLSPTAVDAIAAFIGRQTAGPTD